MPTTKEIDGSIVCPASKLEECGGPRRLLTLDVDDHIDPEIREWLTLDEDGRIVSTPEHQACAAELGVRVEAWRRQQWLTTIE